MLCLPRERRKGAGYGRKEEPLRTHRTIAFQVPEELFDRLKDYLARNGLKQKDFILGLIERELNDAGNEE